MSQFKYQQFLTSIFCTNGDCKECTGVIYGNQHIHLKAVTLGSQVYSYWQEEDDSEIVIALPAGKQGARQRRLIILVLSHPQVNFPQAETSWCLYFDFVNHNLSDLEFLSALGSLPLPGVLAGPALVCPDRCLSLSIAGPHRSPERATLPTGFPLACKSRQHQRGSLVPSRPVYWGFSPYKESLCCYFYPEKLLG